MVTGRIVACAVVVELEVARTFAVDVGVVVVEDVFIEEVGVEVELEICAEGVIVLIVVWVTVEMVVAWIVVVELEAARTFAVDVGWRRTVETCIGEPGTDRSRNAPSKQNIDPFMMEFNPGSI